MAQQREAVILVPGAKIARQGEQLEVLIQGLRNSAESARLGEAAPALIAGLTGKRLPCTSLATGETKQIDFFECHMSDLMPNLSQQSALVKLREGTLVLLFWFTSGMWKGVKAHTYLVLTAIVSALGFLLWYFSVLALGLTALGEVKPAEDSALLHGAASLAADWGGRLGSWVTWLGMTTLLGLVRADRLVDISHFLRRYLTSDELRGAFRSRVRDPLYQVVGSGEYSRVTIMSHSFGTLVATDVLADFASSGGPSVGAITLGSPIGVLRHMAAWIPEELKRCSGNSALRFWIDFSSRSDWMGAPVAFEGTTAFSFASVSLRGLGGFTAQFTGSAHGAYFHRREVMECLLAPEALTTEPARPARAA